MLSRFLSRTVRPLPLRFLPIRLRAPITTSKTLQERKKKLYESQISQAIKPQQSAQGQMERRTRVANFQKFLFEIAREMIVVFTSRSSLQNKTGQVKVVMDKIIARIQREHTQLNVREVIHFTEVVKCMSLMRLEHLQHIEIVYTALTGFMDLPEQQKVLRKLLVQDYEGLSLQMQVRSVSVLQFLKGEARQKYISQMSPLVKHFKSAEMLVLLYQKWKYNYVLTYEVLDQIHSNQYFCSIEDIGQAYLKMLFVDSIREQFSPNDDAIYSRVLNSVNDRPNILAHSDFSKLIKMLHSQNYFLQTEASRYNLEFSLNAFINIAKNQNYDHSTLSLNQLIQIYLGFEQSSSTGEILLSEITFYARVSGLTITHENFALYKQLLLSVIRNMEPKLKYEHNYPLNKEYSNDTVNFLRQMVPKYIPLWPEVILHLNHAANELFLPEDPLLASFQTTFKKILVLHKKNVSVNNISFLTSILRFILAHQTKKVFSLPNQYLLTILNGFSARTAAEATSEQLEAFHLTLRLLGPRMKEGAFCGVIQKIYQKLIEGRIRIEMTRQKSTSPVHSLDDEIMWLALCSAHVRAQGFYIDESLLEIFINEKVLFMLNSLKYMEVVEMLEFVVGLSRLNPEVYERLLCGLSTFLLHISERKSRLPGHYYLNHKFSEQYPKICRMVLDNSTVFITVPNKNAFRVLQVMYVHYIDEFTPEDMLKLLQILSDPTFLTHSMVRLLEEQIFTVAQMEPYEDQFTLRSFEYYNTSLLHFFQGKYNEAEIRHRLKGDNLTRQEIFEYFSKNEVYQTIIMDGELNIRFEMPEPETNIPNIKLMYVLQRIYQRAKQFNNFDFYQDWAYQSQKKPQFEKVDFSVENDYIDRQLMIQTTAGNPFRLDSRVLPRYIKLEVWKSYIFFDKEYAVDQRDLEPNHKKLTDQILNKVAKGCLYGSYEKIREVVKEFSCNEQLAAALLDHKIEYRQHGAAIQILGKCREKVVFTIICTKNTNYKILYICAYEIAEQGHHVTIFKDGYRIETILAFLKKHFSPKQQAPSPAKQRKQEQNEIEE